MVLVDLHDVGGDDLDEVGGKAVGLARLVAAGERVPAGFVITTGAHRRGVVPHEEIVDWWRDRLGGRAVAVRSSATAEDLPDASFAGQQDTVLDVRTADDLVAAVQHCWDSLHSDRAEAYRAALPPDPAAPEPSMGVVVQVMVDASAAGVLFTANPITGLRSQQVVDVAAGLGDVVVDGSVEAEHAELDDGSAPAGLTCVDADGLAELQRAGRRIEAALGGPQDIEFAFDRAGTLWLLQARDITTVFPVPEQADDRMRAYVEVGHMQGIDGPMTPMGQSLIEATVDDVAETFGEVIRTMMRFIGGRIYFDLSFVLRSPRMRRRLPDLLRVYGADPGLATELMAEPRLVPPQRSMRERVGTLRSTLRTVADFGPPLVVGAVQGILDPHRSRQRAQAVRAVGRPLPATAGPRERLRRARDGQWDLMSRGMRDMLPPLYGGIVAREIARGLLGGIADPGEVDRTQGGMPHNPTTEMDLALWQVAQRARPYRAVLLAATPADLARQWRDGTLPEFGLDDFLTDYGHRCAREIDVGVPRWSEDPEAVLAALLGYLRLSDPDQAPDVRFGRAAADAVDTIDLLVARAARHGRPRRGAAAGWLLRRSREISGLRELPKFVWVQAIRDAREQLFAVGSDLADRGVIDSAPDVFWLDLEEVGRLVDGHPVGGPGHGDGGPRDLIETRRARHRREERRRSVPSVLLSTGEVPTPTAPEVDGATVVGRPAAPGVHTGAARVVLDPRSARIEPGEVLVTRTTDPGWTPLFMTAGALVTETGSPMAHGPTVAREYGIPAVIGIRDATSRFVTGDVLTVDGSHGKVTVVDRPPPTGPDQA